MVGIGGTSCLGYVWTEQVQVPVAPGGGILSAKFIYKSVGEQLSKSGTTYAFAYSE